MTILRTNSPKRSIQMTRITGWLTVGTVAFASLPAAALGKGLKSIGQAFVKPVQAVATPVMETVKEVAEVAQTAVTQPAQLPAKIVDSSKDAVTDSVKETAAKTGEAAAASREAVGEAAETAFQATEAVISKVAAPVTQRTLDAANLFVEPLIAKPTRYLGQYTLDPAAQFVGIGAGAFQPLYDPVGFSKDATRSATTALGHMAEAGSVTSNGFASGNVGDMLTGVAQFGSGALELGLNDAVLRVALNAIPDLFWDLDEEEAEIRMVYPPSVTSDANTVFYINGMDTSLEAAIAQAQAIASHLGRAVGLLYNNSHGTAADIGESVYDRFAPLTGAFAPQANRTTRQMAWLLRHRGENISIISHSQGSIIVRNALLHVSKKDSHIGTIVRWVAAGLPLRDEEIAVSVDRLTKLRNSGDEVTEIAGLNMLKERAGGWRDGHGFVEAYLSQVQSQQIWP